MKRSELSPISIAAPTVLLPGSDQAIVQQVDRQEVGQYRGIRRADIGFRVPCCGRDS